MAQATIRLPKEAHDFEPAAHLLVDCLADKYGGFTSYDAQGYWESESGEVYSEEVRIWEVYTNERKIGTFQWFEELAERIADMTNEECVMITVNNHHKLVE